MTSDAAGADPASSGSDGPRPYTGCDLGIVDDLTCQAAGIRAEADYIKTIIDALNQARTQYRGAASAYRSARTATQPAVQDLRTQLSQMMEQMKCIVDDEPKINLLNTAFSHVERRLQDCYPSDISSFDDDRDLEHGSENRNPYAIAQVIARIERRTTIAAAVFDDLIAEPRNLTERVAHLTTEVDAIATRMASGPTTMDVEALYVAVLVARDHLQKVWRGFADVSTYVDYLFRALTFQIKGHAAISKLTREQAVHTCHQEQRAAICLQLNVHTADEVIAEYMRLKSEHPDG